MTPGVEPPAAPWRARALQTVVDDLLSRLPSAGSRPVILAIDGRSGGGKSTVAARVAAHIPGAVIVHTDDVAWYESFFDWDVLLAEGILEPLRRGEAVNFRPPAWDERGREGAIRVDADASVLILEGVGSSRRSLTPHIDASVWVQSDLSEARRRGIERDGGDDAAASFWDEWTAQEEPFLAEDRPWERADLVVCGTPHLSGVPQAAATHVIVGRSLSR